MNSSLKYPPCESQKLKPAFLHCLTRSSELEMLLESLAEYENWYVAFHWIFIEFCWAASQSQI